MSTAHPLSGPTIADVLNDVAEAAREADAKHGQNLGLTGLEWLAVLAEEFGEVAKVVTQREVPPVGAVDAVPSQLVLQDELMQTAATCVRWAHAIDLHEAAHRAR